MSQTSKKSKANPPSIEYRWNPVEGASYEIAGVITEKYTHTSTKNYKPDSRTDEPKSSQILTTAQLVSAVGQAFDYTTSLFQHRESSNLRKCVAQKKDILEILKWETDDSTYGLAEKKSMYSSGIGDFSRFAQSKSDFLRIVHGRSSFKSKHEIFSHPMLRRIMERGTHISIGPWEDMKLSSPEISYRGVNSATESRNPVSTTATVKNKVDNCISRTTFSSTVESTSKEEKCMNCLRAVGADLGVGHYSELASVDKVNSSENATDQSSLHSDYFLDVIGSIDTNNNALEASSSGICTDYHLNTLTSDNKEHEKWSQSTDSDEHFKSNKGKDIDFLVSDSECTPKIFPAPLKSENALAKQEHAFAGAFAGICVSLCLHPVDTVKTVVQSCRAGEKSLFYIGKSIVSERGLSGLYRGISSNIASSAPISAVYTFTYESVKGALLPLFPKEYCSVAHCLAGGSASIATSFIFTPSERIKQQMQVGSRYHNCWHALVGVLRQGGLPSLYAGWGAVLCRNIPHSMIKFYAYENLKQWMLTPGAQPSTSQTLMCGGLAGSTAALFTTPFDVVKTRLQTQTPGTVSRYSGVVHALQEINKHEGLQGLYRGLTPRLVMYISQGALFFSSYEFFKRLIISEESQRDLMV